MSVRVILAANNSIGSKLIRLFTWSPWSHGAILDGDEHVIEATARHGVIRSPLRDLIWHSTRYAIIEIPCDDPLRALDYARRQIGKAYDWQAIFGFIFHRDWARARKWFCFELVAAALDHAGTPAFRAGTIHRVTGAHFWMLPHPVIERSVPA